MTLTSDARVGLATVCFIAAAFSPSSVARAQGCTECDPDTVPRRTLILPALGARVGIPEKVSGAIGLVAGFEWRTNGRLRTRDFALFVEPGVGASRASIAYMDARNFGSGVGIAATVLRTADDTWTNGKNAFAFPPNTTLIGGELLIWPVFLVGPRIGLFHPVGAIAGSRRWFVSADFGFGL